jgi:hypothetical protein
MRCSMFAIELTAVAALLGVDIVSGAPAATDGVVDDSYLAIDHQLLPMGQPVAPVAPGQAPGTDGEDIIFECTVYFTACDPPDDEMCLYIGRDPDEEVARMEALNDCKFENPRRGRYCMVQSCEEITRPEET